jgi:hypothetical protein
MLETVLSQFSSFNPFVFAIALMLGAGTLVWRPPTLVRLAASAKNRRRSQTFWRHSS